MLRCAALQGALNKGVRFASTALRALGDLPWPGSQATSILLNVLDVAEQVHARVCTVLLPELQPCTSIGGPSVAAPKCVSLPSSVHAIISALQSTP